MKILIKLTSMLLCEALHGLLLKEPDKYQVVTEFDGHGIPDFQPDMVIVDLPSLTENFSLQRPDAKIVLIDTGLEESHILSILLFYKLSGIISTTTGSELFRKALEAIHAGQIWMDNDKVKALVENHESITSMKMLESMSSKEKQIVRLISQGFKNKEIAARLAISEQTVKAHLNRIFRKVKVSSRSQLIPLAIKLKFPKVI